MIELYLADCLRRMSRIDDNSIDLTVTSPPYDNLRTYNGNNAQWGEHVWKAVIKDLFRVTKQGGVVVWVVNDKVKKGSETLTSFHQALFFKECGFNVHDTMIWHKPNAMPNIDKSRYCQSFEYMFVLSKGKPKTTNLIEIPTKNGGEVKKRNTLQTQNINKKNRCDKTKMTRIGFNVYVLMVGGKKEAEHPAIFPEQLANYHIVSWSNKGDTILDPFMGSGTTGKIAKQLNRNFIGIELDPDYYEIAKERINNS